METTEDVNQRLLSGYYIYKENEKDILINGIDHTIRELNGKNLTKIPSVIICTKDKNSTRYVSNRDKNVSDTFGNIQSHYKKVIDKKEYSYDFSKFYYIENEGGEGPSKVVLHNKEFNYDGYIYNKNEKKLIKHANGSFNTLLLSSQVKKFTNIKKVSFSEIDPNSQMIYIHVTNNNVLSFALEQGNVNDHKIYALLTLDAIGGGGTYQVCFYFDNLVIEDKVSFSINNPGVDHNSIKVSAYYKYPKPIKEISTITKPENCQYGIYRLRRNGNLYDVNKYIALKFDELAALPTNITNFYTREPTSSHNDPDTIATLLNNPEGGTPGDKMLNIIQPTETITEVYAIKHY